MTNGVENAVHEEGMLQTTGVRANEGKLQGRDIFRNNKGSVLNRVISLEEGLGCFRFKEALNSKVPDVKILWMLQLVNISMIC